MGSCTCVYLRQTIFALLKEHNDPMSTAGEKINIFFTFSIHIQVGNNSNRSSWLSLLWHLLPLPMETEERKGLRWGSCPSYSTTARTSEEDRSVAEWTNVECGTAQLNVDASCADNSFKRGPMGYSDSAGKQKTSVTVSDCHSIRRFLALKTVTVRPVCQSL